MTGLCIVSTGARTPVGLQAAPSAAAARAGILAAGEHPFMVDRAGDPYYVGLDPTLRALGRRDRTIALAISAATEALDNLPQPLTEAIVYLVSTEYPSGEGGHAARDLATQLELGLQDRGKFSVVALPQGNAGGAFALETAAAELSAGRQGAAIIVGADSHIDADVLDTLDVQCRLRCRRHKWGFTPGEAGAAVIVTTSSVARASRMPVLAEIRAVATGMEPMHARATEPCTGAGLGRVLATVLRQSGTRGVAHTLCDVDGERYRDREYAFASQRVPPTIPFNPTVYESIAGSMGAVGGATLPLGMCLYANWAQRGHLADIDVLLWAGSEWGRRGATVLHTSPPRALG